MRRSIYVRVRPELSLWECGRWDGGSGVREGMVNEENGVKEGRRRREKDGCVCIAHRLSIIRRGYSKNWIRLDH